MSKRKLLYGYQIQNGELTVVKAEEAWKEQWELRYMCRLL